MIGQSDYWENKFYRKIKNTLLFGFGIINFWKSCELFKIAYSRVFYGIIHPKLLTEHQNDVINLCSPNRIKQLVMTHCLILLGKQGLMASFWGSVSRYSSMMP